MEPHEVVLVVVHSSGYVLQMGIPPPDDGFKYMARNDDGQYKAKTSYLGKAISPISPRLMERERAWSASPSASRLNLSTVGLTAPTPSKDSRSRLARILNSSTQRLSVTGCSNYNGHVGGMAVSPRRAFREDFPSLMLSRSGGGAGGPLRKASSMESIVESLSSYRSPADVSGAFGKGFLSKSPRVGGFMSPAVSKRILSRNESPSIAPHKRSNAELTCDSSLVRSPKSWNEELAFQNYAILLQSSFSVCVIIQ
ncbi:unnamed protein product [Darwinula stevensoni]|uniref:Uncharacterized protein n=1 Tax=Darwinula stevensoni TaxID=69355 RepID=A0A7R9A3A5_9CRUS|nr:unnamed protein product [Darwinula stevensoni]CAG0881705.1 unnamed protein product [Darwinula stevensoni]